MIDSDLHRPPCNVLFSDDFTCCLLCCWYFHIFIISLLILSSTLTLFKYRSPEEADLWLFYFLSLNRWLKCTNDAIMRETSSSNYSPVRLSHFPTIKQHMSKLNWRISKVTRRHLSSLIKMLLMLQVKWISFEKKINLSNYCLSPCCRSGATPDRRGQMRRTAEGGGGVTTSCLGNYHHFWRELRGLLTAPLSLLNSLCRWLMMKREHAPTPLLRLWHNVPSVPCDPASWAG